MRMPDVAWPETGLVAGIVQDAADGRVLMVGWLDQEALDATISTGLVHFHSRSRDSLWRKGETSGNELRLIALATDCDADAILLTVEPTGPTCHTGARSCFDAGETVSVDDTRVAASRSAPRQGFAWLETLWSTIGSRAAERPDGSYTVRLLDGGVDAVARKLVEEATEVAFAAKDHAVGVGTSSDALAGELADLLYHTLVLCAERGMAPARAIEVLRRRHG